MSDPSDIARRQRRIGSVILGTMLLWVAVLFLAGLLDLPPRWVALADLAALAALAWAVIMAVGLWRARRRE